MSNNYDLSITQGCSFSIQVTARNSDGSYINLSGFTGQGYIRNKYGDTGILLDLAPTIHSSYISGIVLISLTSMQTSGLPTTQALYDLKVSKGSQTTQFLKGYANISPEATF